MTTMIAPSTCHYFTVSSLGQLGPTAREAINAFWNYDGHDVTWGDANRTMIDIPSFLHSLYDAVEAADMLDENGNHEGIEIIEKALDEYRDEVYIDLEN